MKDLFPAIPEDFAALSDEDLATFIDETDEALDSVSSDPSSFVNEELSAADLISAARESADALTAARAEFDSRAAAATEEVEDAPEVVQPSVEELEAQLAALRAETLAAETPEDDDEAEPEAEEKEAVTAAADPEPEATVEKPLVRRGLPRPSKARRPAETQARQVALTAAGSFDGLDKGDTFPDMDAIARAMQKRKQAFGMIPPGTSGEKVPIAFADWRDEYPAERRLNDDPFFNEEQVNAALRPSEIRRMFNERRDSGALVASGGLCAPVTPYYQLQMISVADRPVRAALPAFNADRGGLRFARPAGLTAITTAVGVKTAAEDAAGGTEATKTCQIVDCPDFEETDVQILYHCLQFGNLGARTFPERVTQWNNLVLAAHARLAESELLTGIDNASTQVTAASFDTTGASSNLFSQIMTASSGMRSRNRMAADTVLRIMLPWWSVYLIVSDVFKSQFQRFDVDQAKVVALLRSIDVEPTFYIDGASGRSQVYGAQGAGALTPFPSTVVWYLYPEGSFLYLDGGTLELGLVRDSVLNKTNDFQIFGETFENVAFVGVESLAVVSTVCDNGAVSAPHAVTGCPTNA